MIKYIKRWFSRREGKTISDSGLQKVPVEEKPLSPTQPGYETPEGFLTRYLQYLRGSHAYLKFKGLSHGHILNIALNSVYIALKAVAGEGYQEEAHLDLYKSKVLRD